MSIEENVLKNTNKNFNSCLELYLEQLGLDRLTHNDLSEGYIESEPDISIKINAIHRTSILFYQCDNKEDVIKIMTPIFLSKNFILI